MMKLTFDRPSLLLLSLSLAACSIASDFDRAFPDAAVMPDAKDYGCSQDEPCPAVCDELCREFVGCMQSDEDLCRAGRFIGPMVAGFYIDTCKSACEQTDVTLQDLQPEGGQPACDRFNEPEFEDLTIPQYCEDPKVLCEAICKIADAEHCGCGFGDDCEDGCLGASDLFWDCVNWRPDRGGVPLSNLLCRALNSCQYLL